MGWSSIVDTNFCVGCSYFLLMLFLVHGLMSWHWGWGLVVMWTFIAHMLRHFPNWWIISHRYIFRLRVWPFDGSNLLHLLTFSTFNGFPLMNTHPFEGCLHTHLGHFTGHFWRGVRSLGVVIFWKGAHNFSISTTLHAEWAYSSFVNHVLIGKEIPLYSMKYLLVLMDGWF